MYCKLCYYDGIITNKASNYDIDGRTIALCDRCANCIRLHHDLILALSYIPMERIPKIRKRKQTAIGFGKSNKDVIY